MSGIDRPLALGINAVLIGHIVNLCDVMGVLCIQTDSTESTECIYATQ